eukprot:6250965-Prymnesium_polylepis.1
MASRSHRPLAFTRMFICSAILLYSFLRRYTAMQAWRHSATRCRREGLPTRLERDVRERLGVEHVGEEVHERLHLRAGELEPIPDVHSLSRRPVVLRLVGDRSSKNSFMVGWKRSVCTSSSSETVR